MSIKKVAPHPLTSHVASRAVPQLQPCRALDPRPELHVLTVSKVAGIFSNLIARLTFDMSVRRKLAAGCPHHERGGRYVARTQTVGERPHKACRNMDH